MLNFNTRKYGFLVLILIILSGLFIVKNAVFAGNCWKFGVIQTGANALTQASCEGLLMGGVWQADGAPPPPPPSGPTGGGSGNSFALTAVPGTVSVGQASRITATLTTGMTFTTARVDFSSPGGTYNQGNSCIITYSPPQVMSCSVNFGSQTPQPGGLQVTGTINVNGTILSANTVVVILSTPPTPTPTPSGPGVYTYLAPLDPNVSTFNSEQPDAFTAYLNLMIKIFIGICSVLAVVMIVMGGIEYMTSELVHSKQAGKERIMNALFGLLVALGSYALLNTINPDLLKTNFSSSLAVTTISYEDTPQVPVNGKYTSNGITYNVGDPWNDITGGPINKPSYVSSVNGECQKIGDTNCTSFRGFQDNIVYQIHSACSACNITVSGGTEFWLHRNGTSHRPNSATVDLRIDSALTNYITSGQPLILGKDYKKGSFTFKYEGDHWHAFFQ